MSENTTGAAGTATTPTVSLEKGQNISLTKDNPGLAKLNVGCVWDINRGNAASFDLDLSAILLGADGKLFNNDANNICFFGNKAPNGTGVKSAGDNLTGAGDGDDETIMVDLAAVPAGCDKIAFIVNIYQGASKGQNFGQIQNAYVRAYDATNDSTNLAKYDLSEDYSGFTGVHMGNLYRHDGGWKFKAIGEGKNGDINAIVAAL